MANAVVKKPTKRAAKPAVKPGRVLYLYGVSRVEASRLRVSSEGIDGAEPAEALSSGGFVCWVSRVSRSEFADKLSENMENLDWLATAGVRHQQVVSAIAAQTDILPARFGTVFITEDSLAADVKSRRKSIDAAFERVADADEWGVKVFAEPKPVASATTKAKSGAEYLRLKAASLAKPKSGGPDEEVRQFIEALEGVTVASVAGGKVSGGQSNLMWQASVLVRRGKRKQFENLLNKYASKWSDEKRIECSGPWPPYSFVSEHGR